MINKRSPWLKREYFVVIYRHKCLNQTPVSTVFRLLSGEKRTEYVYQTWKHSNLTDAKPAAAFSSSNVGMSILSRLSVDVGWTGHAFFSIGGLFLSSALALEGAASFLSPSFLAAELSFWLADGGVWVAGTLAEPGGALMSPVFWKMEHELRY